MRIKALSVWEPWAILLATGLKLFETRHWQKQYRGLVGIHAGARWTVDERRVLTSLRIKFPTILAQIKDPVPLGVMLGVARLVDIVPTENIVRTIDPFERAIGNFAPGRFAWRLEMVEVFEKPIRIPGQQGLWDWHWDRAA